MMRKFVMFFGVAIAAVSISLPMFMSGITMVVLSIGGAVMGGSIVGLGLGVREVETYKEMDKLEEARSISPINSEPLE